MARKRPSDRSRVQGGPWTEEDQELADLTRREAAEGGLLGPYTAEELTAILGDDWVPSRRFWIKQGSKLRSIDDFSEFCVNQAFGSGRKASMKSLDHVVALARAWVEAVDSAFDNEHRRFQFQDSDGVTHQGRMHPGWTRESWRNLLGQVVDLKSAYKQLPAAPADSKFNVIAVRVAANRVEYYRAQSLMFGAIAAVYGFLRFSRALALPAANGLVDTSGRTRGLVFFDDFTVLQPANQGSSGGPSLRMLLRRCGWKTAGDKFLDFSGEFVSLGAQVNLCTSRPPAR